MRVATWNCNGRLRGKVDRALAMDADITVIQEAENPVHYADHLPGPALWTDAGRGKGLLAFARRGWAITLDAGTPSEPPFKHVIPLSVTTPKGSEIAIWAVWCMDAPRKADAWVAQLHHALDALPALLRKPIVIAGDLNSNAIWDRDRKLNHSRLVERLAEREIFSAYHRYTGEPPGRESRPTFWLARSELRPFHIDYVFSDLPVRAVEVGTYRAWSGRAADGGASDHAPLIVDFDSTSVE